jgi:hypothetical protein
MADERFGAAGPAFRRRRRAARGVGGIAFILLVAASGVLATYAATFLRPPTQQFIQDSIGIDVPRPGPPPAPKPPVQLN